MHIGPAREAAGPTATTWFLDLSNVLLALIATVLMALLWRSFESGETLRVVWGLLALGMLLWTVGEALWAYYELVLEEDPYPSLADAAWVLGYIPLGIGLFLRFRSLRTVPNRIELLEIGSAFGLLVIVSVIFVIEPIVTADYDPIELFVGALYPIGDLVIAFVALLSVFVLSGGEFSRPWLIIAVGFLTVSVADQLFSYADWKGTYLSGADSGTNLITALVDIPYFASYVIIGLGAALQARLSRVL
jgi:hypothetical protein